MSLSLNLPAVYLIPLAIQVLLSLQKQQKKQQKVASSSKRVLYSPKTIVKLKNSARTLLWIIPNGLVLGLKSGGSTALNYKHRRQL